MGRSRQNLGVPLHIYIEFILKTEHQAYIQRTISRAPADLDLKGTPSKSPVVGELVGLLALPTVFLRRNCLSGDDNSEFGMQCEQGKCACMVLFLIGNAHHTRARAPESMALTMLNAHHTRARAPESMALTQSEAFRTNRPQPVAADQVVCLAESSVFPVNLGRRL